MNSRWPYNAKDCIATSYVDSEIKPHLNENTRRAYEAEMGLQGVCLVVQLRGLRIDDAARKELLREFDREIKEQGKVVEQLAGRSLTGPKGSISATKMRTWLYGELGFRPQKVKGKVSTDGSVLNRFAKRTVALASDDLTRAEKKANKDVAAEVCQAALKLRDISTQRGHVAAPTEHGRHRFTLNVGGTESFRLSSHKSHSGKGINGQNVDKRHRRIYIADPGYTLGQGDQERAESFVVAFASGDDRYIKAHLDGNTHVTVARLIWPGLDWTGDPEKDKSVAKQLVPGTHHTFYDIAKRTQHGLNYMLTPHGLSRNAGVPLVEAERIYETYFDAFPGIALWHSDVIADVKSRGRLVYPGGYERQFFGARNDKGTWREAISSIPQSVIAWNNHIVFSRMFYQLDGPDLMVLNHTHDGVLFQVPTPKLDEMKPKVAALTEVQWPMKGGIMVVPWEFNYGNNWGEV